MLSLFAVSLIMLVPALGLLALSMILGMVESNDSVETLILIQE